MTIEHAKQWLNQHSQTLPGLPEFQRQALDLIDLDTSTLSQMADIICLDPGMSMTLFQQVNGKLEKSGRHRMDSIHSSISVLSEIAIEEFVKNHQTTDTIENKDCCQHYRQLVSCSKHLQQQLVYSAKKQGLATHNDFRIAALLHNCGEMLSCIADFDNHQKYLHQFRASFSSLDAASSVFGFSFDELGTLLCDTFFLPELVSESFVQDKKSSRKASLIRHAAAISEQSELGWQHDGIVQAIDKCREFIAPESQDFDKQIHQVAIQSAHEHHLANTRPAAINLLQTPCFDEEVSKPDIKDIKSDESEKKQYILKKARDLINARQQQQPKNRQTIDQPKAALIDISKYGTEMKAMLMSEQINQAKLVTHLFKCLQSRIHMTETAFMLLTSDKKQLTVKMAQGFGAESTFAKLSLETGRSGLFLTALKNKSPVWISPSNYDKYELYLPAAFKLANHCRNFAIMPLYTDKKPLGLIFASQQRSDQVLSKKTFAALKTVTSLTNRGLSFLAQKKRQKAA